MMKRQNTNTVILSTREKHINAGSGKEADLFSVAVKIEKLLE